MSMFTLAISCLTTSNLSWFMDLTFQVPMQYCSLHHQTLLLLPVTSTTGHCFCFGSVSSFFLELFIHSSSVAYWVPTDLGSSSFNVLSFCLFILFMGFSRQEFWSGLPFPSSVDHILSELSTVTLPSWVALHGMAHSFIELDEVNSVVHVIILISFLWLWYSSCVLWQIRIRGLWKLPDGRDWLWGKLGKLDLVLMGRAVLNKSLVQFSVGGCGCVPSLLFDLRPNYGGGNEDNGDLLQKVPCRHCCTQCPEPGAGHHWPTTPLGTPGHSQASLAQSLVGSLLLSPGFWCAQGFVCASKSLFPQSCGSSVIKSPWLPKSNSLGVLSPFARYPVWEICCGS